ncbi:hypothetical protein [Marinobacter sp.]|jgi:hypothetical protein|uniref:hypothetical protein n=1 Tax=Marinobacter sp. TaxID=50741 RepID=UPI00198F3CDF|nr:hypothetical protein [Marinobacter sp.]MBC7192568.1 hypothetical protein [Marinobacter sp.]
MSKAELLTHLYGDVSLKPNLFDELNPQLGEHILPGQMVVLGDPEGLQCTAKEQELMTAAKQVNAKASELTDEEAQFAADYHDLIETPSVKVVGTSPDVRLSQQSGARQRFS